MFQPKQVKKFLGGWVGFTAFASGIGSSVVVTTPVTAALSGVGDGGKSVPLQPASSTQQGVYVTPPNNKVAIVLSSTKAPILDAVDNEVYGRLTQAAGVYTLSFFSLVGGTETAYSFSASVNIDVYFTYQFSFETVPPDFALAATERPTQSIIGGAGGQLYTQQVTVTGTNTLANLNYVPTDPTLVVLTVNGESLYAGLHFTVTGQAFSFSGAQLTAIGFSIETTDTVFALYPRY